MAGLIGAGGVHLAFLLEGSSAWDKLVHLAEAGPLSGSWRFAVVLRSLSTNLVAGFRILPPQGGDVHLSLELDNRNKKMAIHAC